MGNHDNQRAEEINAQPSQTDQTNQPAEMGERRKKPLGYHTVLEYFGVNIVQRHLTGYCTGARLQALEYEI